MIKSITMKNVGSYKEETTLVVKTPITLIYGNNGAGKTLLSNYLLDIANEKYKDCSINGLENTDNILVYNQKFIEDNFYEDKQQGIFTISKENKEINDKINELEKYLYTKQRENTEILKNEENLRNELNEKESKLKELIYKFKQNYANDKHNIFKDFFTGKHSKDDFYNFIINFKKIDDTSSIEELKAQLTNLKDYKEIDIIKIEEISKLFDTFNDIEQNNIFNDIIVGSSDTTFSKIINQLNNSDWVEKGYKEYMPISDDTCPFCQQKINTRDLTSKIEKYFNKDYIKKKNILIQLQKQYESNYQALNQYISNLYLNTYVAKIEINYIQEIKNIYYEIQKVLESNINMINSKLPNMSSQVTLNSSIKIINNLIPLLISINEKIEKHNTKVNNTNNEKEKIKNKFFNICRNQYDTEITIYISEKEKIKNELDIIKNNQINNEKAIEEYEEQLKEYRASTKNPFKSLNNINNLLQEMGILNFKLKEVEKNFYKIIRHNEDTEIFISLSEGEKMIISFLYFIERCQGIINDDEINKHNKLIVIDDPISSLSFEHIFTIASTIKHIIIEPLILSNTIYENQLLILTHNLYFFHEFYFLDRNNKNFLDKINSYRIFKNNNLNSKFEKINKDDILNDYQSLWKILKDYKKGTCSAIIIPNTMRNILEYFSAFIHNKAYIKIIEKNKNKIFNQTFCRYINRKSHSDKYNISFNQEFCPDVFMKNFEQLFKEWGFEEHYNAMMGIKNNKN